MNIDASKAKEIIAKRVAKELKDGQLVNLGVGLPTMVAKYIPEDIHVTLQTENGMVGMGPEFAEGEGDPYVVNAGGKRISALPGAAFFDSAMSFALIRGGHVDVTVLGALQVDIEGNLANWIIPGKIVPGMGGAMDLVTGAKKVIIAMVHTANGKPKIFKKCTLPLTAKGQVDMIVTELGVMRITPQGLLLVEKNKDVTIEEIMALNDSDLIISRDLKDMDI